MKHRTPTRTVLYLIGVLAFACLVLRGSGADNEAKSNATTVQGLKITNTEILGGSNRYLAYLSTDKPIYRAGETIYMRGVILHHATRVPFPANRQVHALVEIRGPRGDVVAGGPAASEESVLGFQWTVPDGQAGGEYTIKATFPGHGYPPAERKFDIRAYRAPRLKSQIKFIRDGYGPGDEVAATLHVERAEGGIPVGAPVTVTARVDGIEVFRGPASVDNKGDCLARFKLPEDIARGEGTLAMAIEDGGVVETASKTIPILLQTVDLTMYPEGGELVAGFSNRVYFEAFTPAKKPADLAGVILDGDGSEVAEFRSEHEGRGRFAFIPEKDGKYTLKITEPSGIATQYPLPAVKEKGVALGSKKDVFAADEPVALSVACAPVMDKLQVTLAKREEVIAKQTPEFLGEADATRGLVEFELAPDDPDGVLIATVWDKDGMPLAERLIFRQPARAVNVNITADHSQYVPGGRARITFETTNAVGKPVDAVVGVTVTDDSVLEMIERREQAPRLPVMVLLEGEVRELADAHVYLDPDDPQAPLAVDLLLGTQGWRRFAFVSTKTEPFLQEHGDAARRVLSLGMVTMREIHSALGRRGGAVDLFGAMEGLEFEKGMPADEDGIAPPPVPFGDEEDAPAAVPEEPALAPAAAEPPPPGEPADDASKEEAAAEMPAASRPARVVAAPRQEMKERARLADALDRNAVKADRLMLLEAEEEMPVRNDFVAVRIYAHHVRSGRQPGERIDFTETLFWHAGMRTGPEGKASIEFGLNDSVTSFRVFGDAFGSDGALGSDSIQIDSVEPFYLEPKLPLEVTMGDVIRTPIGIVNATGSGLDNVSVEVQAHGTQNVTAPILPFSLTALERVRRLVKVRVGKFNGQADFTLLANAGPYSDRVTRTMMVRPLGFPIEDPYGGLIQPGDTVSHEFSIPDDLVRGSLSTRIVVYPTPLASMTEALERLIREPYGCFEQTSSTVYPLVMAQQYFMSHQGVDPTLIERSSQILTTGYDRLMGFECQSGGFEWFGNDPGHDALTAYGLLEFTDMSKVRHVDPAVLDRTRTWMLAQRDGQGGFARKTHTLHTWLAEPEVANTYNTWALLEAEVDADLAAEIAWVRDAAERTDNTYVMALAANVLASGGDDEGANHMLDKLAGKQTENGSLSGATTSVVGSGGEALVIETTSLAVLAWLKNPRYAPNVERSIQYLAESCKAGRFGSTQSTVLALRAIVTYDQSRAKPKAPGSLQLLVDGKAIGEAVEFTADTEGAIELPEASEFLTPGKHQLQIQMTGGSQMPYSVTANYNSLKPNSSDACKLHLEAALRDERVEEGNVTEAEVRVINRTGKSIPTPLAIIGIPGGLEVRHDQLKELVKEGKIAAYEVLGREVVLYWRALKAEERVDLPISLVAAIPGTYTGPASRAYLYYTDEHKHWIDGLKVRIAPKQ